MSKVQAGYKSTKLRDIPEDWEIVSLADVADPNKHYALTGGPFGSDLKSEEYTESGIRIIQLQNIKEGYFSNGYKIYTSEEKANQLFNCNIFPNDIIIAKMAEPVARACIIPNLHERYLMASDGIRLAVNKEDYSTKYVMYAVNSSYFRKQAVENSTGTTRLRIGLKTLKGLKLLKPSKKEQQKIATILSVVDKDIEKTEAIIEQTEKVKKALMQQLLTKGIGHTKFKKTEIGEIPEAWELVQIQDIGTLKSGTTPSRSEQERYFESGTIPWIKTMDLNNGEVISTNERITDVALEETSLTLLPVNTVLVAMYGGFKQIGRTGILKVKATINQALTGIIVNEILINPYYLQWWLNAKIDYWKNFAASSRKDPNITKGDVLKFPVVLPTLSEQKKIVDILSSVNRKIENEMKKLSQLQGLKEGLIQSLLTGKVRVRVDETEVI
ncbi:hypothetical protein COF61_09245 [Bacillus toyonensis]|uniref:restriction endonuclease subunit S n=1 Tax=Bacillus toyonensis TaxID=155322 RepID=UPI000BFD512A|nr:restriction endonuclease subunit S [Bacillus toyonensis]PHD66636.1 hypothetical protein COF61_09245 [Bacillus toyonensis]